MKVVAIRAQHYLSCLWLFVVLAAASNGTMKLVQPCEAAALIVGELLDLTRN